MRPPVVGTVPNSALPIAFLAGAAQADETDHLAGMELAIDRSHLPDHDGLEDHARLPHAPRRATKDLRRLAPDDQQDHLLRRRLVDPALAGHPAVAQHHHAIGDLEHLIEPMRDVDDADPTIAQAAQSDEQARHLVGGEAGGRLVEHEDLRFRGQRARDRDQRFLGPAEALDAHIRVDVSVEHFEGCLRRAPSPPASRSGGRAADSRG